MTLDEAQRRIEDLLTGQMVEALRAFGDEPTMRLQLNVRRFVAVHVVPVEPPVDSRGVAPHVERRQIGAGHAGWLIGRRDAIDPGRPDRGSIETYAYAGPESDFPTRP